MQKTVKPRIKLESTTGVYYESDSVVKDLYGALQAGLLGNPENGTVYTLADKPVAAVFDKIHIVGAADLLLEVIKCAAMTETELEWFAQGKEKNWLLGRGLNVDSPFFGCLRGATSGDVRTMIYNLKAQDAIELAPRLYPKLRVKGD